MFANKIAIISDQIDNDLRTAAKRIREEGYEYVELHNVFGKSIEECSEAEAKMIKMILDEYGLEVVNIASTIFFLCPLYPHYRVSLFNDNFYSIKGDVQYHLAMLHKACRVAKILECKTIRVFPFRFPDNEEIGVVGTEADQNRIMDNLKKAVEIAEQYDVVLALENCPYSHCPKGEMTYRMVHAIGSPNLKLLWDPANSYRAEKNRVPLEYQHLSLLEEYELIKDEIVHVHLKNYEYDETQEKSFVHRELLAGDIDYVQLLSKMNSYTNAFSLEPEVELEEAIHCMQQLKSIKE